MLGKFNNIFVSNHAEINPKTHFPCEPLLSPVKLKNDELQSSSNFFAISNCKWFHDKKFSSPQGVNNMLTVRVCAIFLDGFWAINSLKGPFSRRFSISTKVDPKACFGN